MYHTFKDWLSERKIHDVKALANLAKFYAFQANILKFGFFLLWNPLKLKWINFHGFSGYPLSIFNIPNTCMQSLFSIVFILHTYR